MIQIFFAFLAGILTVGAPCILPLLPILLGASIGQQSKTRPLFIVGGFVLVFAALGAFLSWLTINLGIDPTLLRNIAIALLAVFGLLMVWPKPFELLSIKMNFLINRANHIGTSRGGNSGGFLLGMMLGVIWTPCAGPVLGAILTLVATQENLGRAALLLIAYAIGSGIPMLIIAYGSQYVTTGVRSIAKYSVYLQQGFGILILALAVAMFLGYDIQVQAKLASLFPSSNLESKIIGLGSQSSDVSSKKSESSLKNLGPAPEFKNISHWINSEPLTMKSLEGKVVLVDFWTYSCINCIRTLPYVTQWYEKYKDQGLVIVGVHTPEFPFEKVTANVEKAVKDFKINYPVAQDNDFGTWNNYNNQYWPAEYLIDQQGNIVYTHFGEGNYDLTENTIRQLLGLDADTSAQAGGPSNKINSPEMYFGTNRLEYLSASQQSSVYPKVYTMPENLRINTFALEGSWSFDGDKTVLAGLSGKIKLHFSSGKVFMVADSPLKTAVLKITVDGKLQPDVMVSGSQLYTLFDSVQYKEHTLEIEVSGEGFEAFTFTFG